MKRNILLIAATLTFLALLLTACGGTPNWEIASEGVACTSATVIDRYWSDNDPRDFRLLLKTEDGQIGKARVNAYVYDAHQIGDTTCVIR